MKILRFLLQYGSRRFALVAALGGLGGVASAALIAIVTQALSHVSGAREHLALFGGLVLVTLGTSYGARLLSIRLTQRTNYDLRMKLCREIVATPLRNAEEIGRDKVLATLIDDVQTISTACLALPNAFLNLTLVLGCLGFLGWLSMPALLSLLVFIALATLSVVIPEQRVKGLFRLARSDWDELVSGFRDLTEGEKELRMNRQRRERFLSEHLSGAAATLRDRRIQSGSVQAKITSWFQVLYFVYIGLLIFGLPGVNQHELIGFTVAILFIRQPLASLVGLVSVLNQASVGLEHVEEIGLRLTTASPPEAAEPEAPPSPCMQLRLEDVVYTYRGSEDERFTLGPISFEVGSGEIMFITGGNGSGKTTLAKVLTGLYPPDTGRLLLDGRVIEGDEYDWYRQHFSTVFSDFYLFASLMGIEAADVEKNGDAYLSKLDLAHKVRVEGGKFSTRDLSRGQRKRLALLTAYLEDRPIYVFDEWAADQDPEFKEVFYRKLLPELKAIGKVIIVISHDDRYFAVADRLIWLEAGSLATRDSVTARASRLAPVQSIHEIRQPE